MIIKRRNPSLAEISKRVQEEFRCSHSETIRCKKLKSNNTEEFRNQCKRCGVQVSKAIRKDTLTAQEIAEMPLWNDEIGKSFHDAMAARSNALYQEDEKCSLEEWRGKYEAYRKTPEWQARRQLVLLRAQGICEGCRRTVSSFTRRKNSSKYPLESGLTVRSPSSTRGKLIGNTGLRRLLGMGSMAINCTLTF